MENGKYKVAKYMRLSRDDGDDRESESIENQRDIIDNYIEEHEDLEVIGEYVDDGFTGTYYNKRFIKTRKRSYRYRVLFRKILSCKSNKVYSNSEIM